MKRFAPNFLLEQVENRRFSGELNAIVINFDIVGFTKTTDLLIEKGKSGIEMLSEIINGIFSPIVAKIHAQNGFIASFAGDSMTVIFPHNIFSSSDELIYFASSLLRVIEENPNSSEVLNQYPLSAKSGLSTGKVKWKILQGKVFTPFFYGDAIEVAALAQKHALENKLAISDDIFKTIQTVTLRTYFTALKEKYLTQTKIIDYSFPFSGDSKLNHYQQDKFVSKQLLQQTTVGEFRSVVSCFIKFSTVEFIIQHFSEINELISQNGGFLNKIFSDDKGYQILVLFGAPKTTENIAVSSTNFALQMKQFAATQIRIGYSMGVVFAGFVGNDERCEYTALGTEVNKAARLMMKAEAGEVLTDSLIPSRLKKTYRFEYLNSLFLKGFSQMIEVYSLHGETKRKLLENTIFIGRTKELKLLKKKIKKSCSGTFGGIFFIEGEAGIGKSYLLEKLQHDLETELYWTSIICDEILHSSLFPLKIYIKNFFKIEKQSDENAILEQIKLRFQEIRRQIKDANIEKLWNFSEPYLLELLEIENPDLKCIEKKIRFENTLYALKNFFLVLSSIKPVVIVIDDGQWIDNDTTKFLEILVRNAENHPLIILFASRILTQSETFLVELSKDKIEQIKLSHFSQKQMLEFLQENLKTETIPQDTLDLFAQKTEGNPFYLSQLLMYLQENEQLTSSHEIIAPKVAVPDSISSIIIARIDRLTHELKQVVQTASILGREFAANVLSKMLQDIPVKNYLAEGEKEFIWNAITELKYIFKHSLLRETVYEMQLKKRIRALHRLAAETYLDLYQNSLAEHYMEICFHFERAEEFEKLKYYLNKAIDYSIKRSRIHDGTYFMERLHNIFFSEYDIAKCLHSIIIDKDIEPYINVALYWAEYLALGGKTKKALKLFEQTIGLIKKWGNQIVLLKGIISENKLLVQIGEYQKGLDNIKFAEEILKMVDAVDLQIEINNSAGQFYTELGEYAKAIEYYQAALNRAAVLSDESFLSVLYTNLGVTYSYLGKYDKAIDFLNKSMEIENTNEKTVSKIIILGDLASIYYEKNDLKSAEEIFKKTFEMSSDIGYKSGIAVAAGNLAAINRYLGNVKVAFKQIKIKLDISKEIGDKKGLCLAYNSLGNMYLNNNDFEKAIDSYHNSQKIAKEMKDMTTVAIVMGNIGEIYYHKKKYKAALEEINKAIEIEYECQFLSHLFYLLCLKTKILLDWEKYEEAQKVNDECFKQIKKADFPQFFFKTELYREIIDFRISENPTMKKEALVNLHRLLKSYQDLTFQTHIAYEIALMMKELDEIEPAHIEKSIELLQKLGLEGHEEAKNMMKQLQEMQKSYLK